MITFAKDRRDSLDYYIGYKEAEKLLGKYKALKALLTSLQIELERIYFNQPTEGLREEDVLYALYFARELSDMPRSAPNPGDKMTNVILSKDRIMQVEYPQELINSIKIVGEVAMKITVALTALSAEERRIIELRDIDCSDWKVLEESMSLERRRLGEIRKVAIEKMLPIMRVTIEQYEFCVGVVR